MTQETIVACAKVAKFLLCSMDRRTKSKREDICHLAFDIKYAVCKTNQELNWWHEAFMSKDKSTSKSLATTQKNKI
jgi:hypothetical protein